MNESQFEAALRLQRAGDLGGASEILRAIAAGDPGYSHALYLLGFIAMQRGDLAEAERHIGDALRLKPDFPDARFSHGRVLLMLGRLNEALGAFDALTHMRPNLPSAWLFRGIVLVALQRHEEALAVLDRAIALDPNLPEAWSNRGSAETGLGRFEEALASFTRSLALRPNHPGALMRHGNALAALNRFALAVPDYERALAIDPDIPFARGDLVFAKLNCCDWRGLQKEKDLIAAGIAAGKRVVQPGVNLALATSPEMQLQAAQIWAADVAAGIAPLPSPPVYRHEKIRVAYLSADFRERVVAHAAAGIFENHNRSRFETIAVAFGGDDGSALRNRLKRSFDRFIDVTRESDRAIADLLRGMEVDIAVDMMGYTTHCRPAILVLRPAPIQVGWLGYPGTTGAAHMDYIIADPIVIPEEHKHSYSEKPVWMPNSYLPYDSERRATQRNWTRAEEGLPERGFVFASFNNVFKFGPETFDIWMRLLLAVEGSVLWLPNHGAAVPNFKKEAEARGVSADRLVFASYVERPNDHLARLSLADLFLDTLPYGAHTSAADALRAGVPVVTCLGAAFPGRVAASLLTALGLPELIAPSASEYESLALRLARDSGALGASRNSLAAMRESAALFDSAAYAQHLEQAFQTMVRRQLEGLPPACFAVQHMARNAKAADPSPPAGPGSAA